MKHLIYFLMLTVVFISCKEKDIHGPATEGVKPPSITEYTVENLPGAAEVTYDIPDLDNTMYVVAEYESEDGELKSYKASRYRNQIRLEGFKVAKQYDVKLYAVGEGEQYSTATTIEVEPLTPPYIEAFNTLKVAPTWSGVAASYTNTSETNLVLEMLEKNEKDEWEIVAMDASNLKDAFFTERGYSSDLREFGFCIRDRWMNYSDTLFADIKPYFEKRIKMEDYYVEMCLPTDVCEGHKVGANRHMGMLFDRKFVRQQDAWFTAHGTGIPGHWTIDLGGDTWNLSRVKLWHLATTTYAYKAGNVKRFEVYGSMDPNPDGSWESWTLLGEFENVKPSPGDEVTTEDIEILKDGVDYEFSYDIPAVRYLRFNILETWGLLNYMYIVEMEIYGSRVD